ncbi:hypothetical protein CCR75_001153 [Bremia lactucae]|uniref:Uncharacterized protein n=1 Tax=Bremia lactucae TaxID=4779 RepID=A0A976FQ95_BRELC|nr:hypothetical protein CCR75_001153 [Bremia lactucae]
MDIQWRVPLGENSYENLKDARHATSSAIMVESNLRRDRQLAQRSRLGAASARFKRKKISKQLQLLCLQRYAQYAKDYGRISDKFETQQILHQSYVQFLKGGGEPEEHRLSYKEFLKIVRNRRSEINARAHRIKHDEDEIKQVVVLTPAKMRKQVERDKIRELIETIERTREQIGRKPSLQYRNRQSFLKPFLNSSAQTHMNSITEKLNFGCRTQNLSSPKLDPMEITEALLLIQRKTQAVQREIAARLEKLSCVIRQHESHKEEPPSASV